MSGILAKSTAVIRNVAFRECSIVSGVLAGGGIAYSLYGYETPKYEQTMLAIFMPSLYAGYHSFKYANKLHKEYTTRERLEALEKTKSI